MSRSFIKIFLYFEVIANKKRKGPLIWVYKLVLICSIGSITSLVVPFKDFFQYSKFLEVSCLWRNGRQEEFIVVTFPIFKLFLKLALFVIKTENATALFYPQNKKGEEVTLIENNEENREKLCHVISLWNCTKLYSSASNNCQKFATELFESVGLNGSFSSYSGYIGEFIR